MALAGLSVAADWLFNPDQPEKSDAIIILAGDPARAFHAADLYSRGFARKIYISRAIRLPGHRLLDEIGVAFPRYEEIDRQVLMKKGVPEGDIFILAGASSSTADEAVNVAKLFERWGARLLLVTSPHHVRRARMVFGDLLPKAELRVVATPYEALPSQWWKNQDAARNVVLELAKILFYFAGGGFHAAGSSS